METRPAGSQWLKERFLLPRYTLTHSSYIGSNESVQRSAMGNIEQVYGPRYAPAADTPLDHLEFSLKYDDMSLDFLKTVMEKIESADARAFIERSPSGKYSRKIGFLYEFLTGKQINLAKSINGNYVDLLEPEKYITGASSRNPRWKVNDNLLGGSAYCPIIRKTNLLKPLLAVDISEKINTLKDDYPPEIYRRAIGYLYKKETKSSYEIEHEQPSPDRADRFVALLMRAGSEDNANILAKHRLVQLQNAIVDPRFEAKDFRDFQNFVGQTLPNYEQLIHYICPPPDEVAILMDGLQKAVSRAIGSHPVARAAIAAFGFIFIHPFEDGNGRIHRFLIHDILVRDKLVPTGQIIPVSAHMVNHMNEYDDALEKYSSPLMQRIKYEKLPNEGILISNPENVNGYFRYPDLTEQCTYLMKTVHATLDEDMPEELIFLQRYGEARRELQQIVDMPDKEINLMLIFLHQNKGVFPKRRREHFSMLTDGEIAKMESAYRSVYEINNPQG